MQDIKFKLIQVGIEEFAKNSLKNASTRDITTKAGVNIAAISYYYAGKENLYEAVIRHICDYVKQRYDVYFERIKQLKMIATKEEKIALAKDLIVDFMMERVVLDNSPEKLLRNVSLIITREELYPTKAYDMIFAELILPTTQAVAGLVELASDRKILGVNAQILSQMFFGQVMPFAASRVGFKRVLGWEVFTKKEYDRVKKIFKMSVERSLGVKIPLI